MNVPTLKELSDQGISPEILFWVGCAGSFDDRAKKITKSFVRLLNKANISFGVLGTEESCTGDPAKRAGNEFLFQMQALTNIETLNSYNIKRTEEAINTKAKIIAAGSPFCNTMLSDGIKSQDNSCLLYTSPSPRDGLLSRMPSSA